MYICIYQFKIIKLEKNEIIKIFSSNFFANYSSPLQKTSKKNPPKKKIKPTFKPH